MGVAEESSTIQVSSGCVDRPVVQYTLHCMYYSCTCSSFIHIHPVNKFNYSVLVSTIIHVYITLFWCPSGLKMKRRVMLGSMPRSPMT